MGEHSTLCNKRKNKLVRLVWLLQCAPEMRWDGISECTGCLVQNPQPLGLHLHLWVGYGHIRTKCVYIGISQSDSTSVTRLIPRPSLPPVFNHLQKPNLLFLYTVSVINKRMGRLGTVTQLNIEDCQSAVVTQIFKMEIHVGSLAKG